MKINRELLERFYSLYFTCRLNGGPFIHDGERFSFLRSIEDDGRQAIVVSWWKGNSDADSYAFTDKTLLFRVLYIDYKCKVNEGSFVMGTIEDVYSFMEDYCWGDAE